MRYIICWLLILISAVWGVVTYAFQIASGSWLSIIPLIGLGVAALLSIMTAAWFVRNGKHMQALANMCKNLYLVVQRAEHERPAQLREFMQTLTLPPEQFRKRMQ